MFCELVPWLVDVDVEELGEELCELVDVEELLPCELDGDDEVLFDVEELCELLDDAELEDELLFCELDCGVEVLLGDDVGVVDGGVELLLCEPDEEDDVELDGVDGGVELCELVGVEEDDEDDEGGLELCELDGGVELELLLCEPVDVEELLPCEPVLWLVCDEEGLDD